MNRKEQINLNIQQARKQNTVVSKELSKLQDERIALVYKERDLEEQLAQVREQIETIVEKENDLYQNKINPLYDEIKALQKEYNQIEDAELIEASNKRLADFKARKDHPAVIEFLCYVIDKDIAWFTQECESYVELGLKAYCHKSTAPKTVQNIVTQIAKYGCRDEEIIKIVVGDAESRLAKLNAQVVKKVGNIIKADLRFNYNSGLDGVVTGELGKATLTTILAGGYNIQRLHYRTLIKEIK